MDVKAIRDGLKTRLDTVDGLRVHDTIPDDLTPPAAVVVPDEPFIEYQRAMAKGLTELQFRVTLFVSRTSMRSGQDLLDEYLSAGTGQTKSIVDAIHGDRTLGAVAADTKVSTAGNYGTTEVADSSYLTAEIRVAVYADRK